jgi:hypothetical protein
MQQKIGYFFIAFVLLTVLLTAFLVWRDYKTQFGVNSYDDCARQPGSTTVSYPDRPDECVLPSGQTFKR